MSWRSLAITHPARLSLSKGQLLIEQQEKITVPLEDIAIVVIEAKEVVLTAPLLSAFASYGITLFTCDRTFLPCGQWLPFSQHHRFLGVIKKQLCLTLPSKKKLWQKIVQSKVRNQAWVLNAAKYEKSAEYLERLALAVQSGDKSYVESRAAAFYFKELFGLGFSRQSEQTVNDHLNYGYSVLRAAIARALTQYGFLSVLGIWHKNELNSFNLADDLIEPFRPLVDLWLINQGKELPSELTQQSRMALISLLHHSIKIEGATYSVLAAIEKTVSSLQTAINDPAPCTLALPQMMHLQRHEYE